jgi:ligand-binding sensor protein
MVFTLVFIVIVIVIAIDLGIQPHRLLNMANLCKKMIDSSKIKRLCDNSQFWGFAADYKTGNLPIKPNFCCIFNIQK